MKIMIVNAYYYPEIIGGAENSVKKLAEGLVRYNNSVTVMCTGMKDSEEIINGVRIVRFKPQNTGRGIPGEHKSRLRNYIRLYQDIWNEFNYPQIDKIIEKYKPEVIHTNGLYNISPIVWKIAKRKGIPVVHTLRDYSILCPLVVYNCGGKKRGCKHYFPLCAIQNSVNKVSTRMVDYVTAPSAVTLNTVLGKGFFSHVNSSVVSNATEFNFQKSIISLEKKGKRQKGDKIQFVYLGGLTESKGVLWLLEAFATLDSDQVDLFIAGKGPLEHLVVDYSKKYTHISYCGFLNEKEVASLLDRSDVLLCPSLWQEPFGRVVLDAYMHGLPVIANNSGALPELVHNRKTGILIDNCNRDSLKEAVLYFVEQPEDIYLMGRSGIDELAKYSIDNQITAFTNIYNTLV